MSGTLRLRGATSGYSELQAPAVAADQTFVLPTAGGTLLTTDSPVPKLTLELGSASQPSLTFEGDTDTGLYSSGTNTLNLVTGGSDRLVIDSSGRLSLGATSSTVLSTFALSSTNAYSSTGNISNDNVGLKLFNTNGSDGTGANNYTGIQFNVASGATSSGSLAYVRTADNQGAFVFNQRTGASSYAEAMRIDSSGNVGIGTTTTTSLGSGFKEVIVSGGTEGAGLQLQDTDGNVKAGLFTSDVSNFAVVRTITNHPLVFRTNNTERMRIDSSGNVGIGTSSPSNELVVNNSALGANTKLEIKQSGGGGGTSEILFSDSVEGRGRIYFDHGSSPEGIKFATAGSDALIIDTSQRVGIGTTSPNTPLGIVSDSSAVALTIHNRTANDYGYLRFQNNAGTETQAYIGCERTGTNAGNLLFETAGSEAARIDSSGRVGIGVSTMAGGGGDVTIIRNSALRWAESDGTQRADIYGDLNSNIVFRNGTSSTERMRIDSSGRLLVGTSSARGNLFNTTATAQLQSEGTTNDTSTACIVQNNSAGTDGPRFVLGKSNGSTVGSNTIVSNGNGMGVISFQGNDGAEFVEAATIKAEVDGTPGANDMPGRLVFSTTADGASSPTERMRIKNYGQIYTYVDSPNAFAVGTSASTSATNACIYLQAGATGIDTGTITFRVQCNGDVDNTNNSYGAISDVKLKENIVDANSQWSDIKSIQVRNYNYKEETGFATHTQIGVIAQEIESVSPGLVTDTPDVGNDGNDLDTTTKSVNYSVLYMKAVKALQEAMDRIETLEAKVAALEAS